VVGALLLLAGYLSSRGRALLPLVLVLVVGAGVAYAVA